MKIEEANEYHEHNCHFFGKLAIVSYYDDMKKDPKFGTFNAGLIFDYLEKAEHLIQESYGNNVKILLSIPTLVVRIF